METRAEPSQQRKKKAEERHHVPALVGRIVEKGFSTSSNLSPTRPPQPSVLPFPVARHRSQGPHWAPVRPVADGREEAEDDRDETDYNPIASHAKPPKRKERKVLDFSRWREVTSRGQSKEVKLGDGKMKAEVGRARDGLLRDHDAVDVVGKEELMMNMDGDCPGSPPELTAVERGSTGTLPEEHKVDAVSREGVDLGSLSAVSRANANARMEVDQVATPSLADEIDVENRVRLGQMSQEEITEAQDEIMERMSPAVLEMLKRRGQNKTEGRRSMRSLGKDKAKKEMTGGGSEASNGGLNIPKQAEGTGVSGTPGSLLGTTSFVPSGVHDTRAWKSWSQRVERVRELRFSCDGNAIQRSSSEQIKACSQYTPENVAERDYLRTDGDPAAAGYTIKEAVALVRSMVPAQRSFALHLLASIFDKALSNLHQQRERCNFGDAGASSNVVDWKAVWAYALGPEPEVALTLRIALDDNHDSVVLSCTKVIQCLLCCDQNETFFNLSEKSSIHAKAAFSAPVFRSRPEIGCGFLHSGYWKYNTKPSNILSTHDPNDGDKEDGDKGDGTHTIQDDVVVAGQDFAAGLVRMGVLPRICYLLEMDPSPPLDEFLVSILVSLARHSPTCSNAVMKCPRLVQTVFDRFSKLTSSENLLYQIKAVMLFKVLSEANKRHCLDFINRGFFQRTMSHLYSNALSLDDSIHAGKRQCKLSSGLMVQQLRFWKVCIRYGYCLSYFADFFTAMCFWLSPPTFGTTDENNFLGEYTSVTTETFLVLEALSQRLPCVHSFQDNTESSETSEETWSWSHVVPMVEFAMKWLLLKDTFDFTTIGGLEISDHDHHARRAHVLWVISAVLHMLSSIINRISPELAYDMRTRGTLPWLPNFVPKIGLAIVKNGFLKFVDSSRGQSMLDLSLVDHLCLLMHGNDREASLASACCLHGLIELIISIDNSIQRAKASNSPQPLEKHTSSIEDNILSDGISKAAEYDLVILVDKLVNLVGSSWQTMQSIEMFGRGGPAPGVGLGWGSSGGGFWSLTILQAQIDAWLLQSLYKIFPILHYGDIFGSASVDRVSDWPINSAFPILQKINSVIETCSIAGPSDRFLVQRALNMLLQVSTFKFLGVCIHHLLHTDKRFKPSNLQFSVEDYALFSNALDDHFHSRWLTSKKKSCKKGMYVNRADGTPQRDEKLQTIPEDVEMLERTDVCQVGTSLLLEWAHQRLPLHVHWFLSPLCTVSDPVAAQALYGSSTLKSRGFRFSGDPTEVVKGGLLFLLGLEAVSYFLSRRHTYSPILSVPLVWNLHALSMMLIIKLEVLDDARFRDVFENLQILYGLRLQEVIIDHVKESGNPSHQCVESNQSLKQSLDFQKHVHESYNTFIETLVEQFASISYGDVSFGRQVAVYLHRSVDGPTRLAMWNTLTNARVLELLPSLRNCISEPSGYLEPIEDNEVILEAYARSWTSGALDRAAMRGSISYALALHHLSCFIFHYHAADKLQLRNKLVKSLLRGFSRKRNQEGMMLDLIKYEQPLIEELDKKNMLTGEGPLPQRFLILYEACEGNSSLLTELEKLKSSLSV